MNFLSNSLRNQPGSNNNSTSAFKSFINGGVSRSSLTSSSSASLATFTSAKNDSNSALSSKADGSGMRLSRKSISRHPPAGTAEAAVDVIDVLRGIIGELPVTDEKPPKREDGLDLLSKSLDIIAKTKESRPEKSDTDDSDLANYDEKMKEFENLHKVIEVSDVKLKEIQEFLSNRQGDLDMLSKDMESLEVRSRQISAKLKAKQTVENKLAPIVEALIIPPMIVRQIADGEISLQWKSALKYIVQRQNELIALKNRGGEVKAIKGAEGQLKLVVDKAIERIRDFIVTRIKSLRVAGINAQAIQKDLLNYRELYSFLAKANPSLSKDLLQAYINTMIWYYNGFFLRYFKSLEKLNLHKVDKTVLLGSDDSSRRGLLFYSRSGPTMKAADTLTLGNRANIISSDDPSVMLAQIAETNTMRHWMEVGFRSFNLALIDNITVEYQFLTEFFKLKNGDEVTRVFNNIFEKTFQVGQEFTKFLLEDSYDAFGILICIRLVRKLEFELQHRRIPVGENYLNLQLINLWPRFQIVMDGHCDSLRRATSRASIHNHGDGSGSALVPHHITQTFSSFISGILTLCEGEDNSSEPVSNSIQRLRNEFELLLTKISADFPKNKREVFLYNNYFLVCTILSDVTGQLAEKEKEHFKLLTDAYEENATRK